ncbi:MAG: LptF/LptG family permease [Treponema sp.]
MKTKGDLLREEARKKFSPFWKKISEINEKISNFFSSKLNKFKEKHPNLPKFSQLAEKISSFSLRKKIVTLCLKISQEKGNQKAEKYFTEKLLSFDEVKNHVITRYLIKELFLYFIVSFLFFFMIFFVNQILLMAETILKKRVPVMSVIKLIIYSLPAIIAQSAPFATLVGFLMCLGRMVTDNEVLILRASGQRYIKILKPVIFMGVAISLVSFFVNDYLLPVGTIQYNKLYRNIIVSNPAVELEPHSVKRMNDSTIVIGDVDKKHVSDLVFFDTDNNGNQRIIIAKDSDILKAASPGVLMQLNMNDSSVLFFNKGNRTNYDVLDSSDMRMNIFESSIINTSNGVSPREMTSYDLLKKIVSMEKKEKVQKRQMNTYKLEYNKKFSIPFGSFFFALLALPLALIFGKKDGQTLGLIFGIIISVLYWAATILGQMFGLKSGYNGFVMMWAPNLLIGMLGIILYFKLVKK